MCHGIVRMLCGFGIASEENWSYISVKWHYTVYKTLRAAYISSNILWYIMEKLALTQFSFSMDLDETLLSMKVSSVFSYYLHIVTMKENFQFYESFLKTSKTINIFEMWEVKKKERKIEAALG